jgi:monoamine oxidase
VSTKRFDVVIVGAGAAGLAALRDLDRAGKNVLCLEARDRIGGRIYTVHDSMSPIPIELGAEFVHGLPPEIVDITESAPLVLYKCTENAIHVRNGKIVKSEDAWLQVDDVMRGIEAAVEQGHEETFSAFLARSNYSNEAKELATSYVEGFNAARAEVIGIASLAKDQEAADEIDGDRAFRLMGGYDAVPRWMIQGIEDLGTKLKFNSEVRAIRWKRGSAAIEFASGVSGAVQTVEARQVVITVPLGVLQAEPGAPGTIRFDPEPVDVLAAARRLQFGHVVRLILRFQEAFWEENEDFAEVGFLLSNEKHFPTWWTPLPVRARSITGWSSGPHCDELLGLPQSEIVRRAICDLARILSTKKEKLAAGLAVAYLHDWHADALARGVYSYVPAHAANAREKLAQPVGETLYFTGEATELNGHSATVHGAIASGRRTAKQILQG